MTQLTSSAVEKYNTKKRKYSSEQQQTGKRKQLNYTFTWNSINFLSKFFNYFPQTCPVSRCNSCDLNVFCSNALHRQRKLVDGRPTALSIFGPCGQAAISSGWPVMKKILIYGNGCFPGSVFNFLYHQGHALRLECCHAMA